MSAITQTTNYSAIRNELRQLPPDLRYAHQIHHQIHAIFEQYALPPQERKIMEVIAAYDYDSQYEALAWNHGYIYKWHLQADVEAMSKVKGIWNEVKETYTDTVHGDITYCYITHETQDRTYGSYMIENQKNCKLVGKFFPPSEKEREWLKYHVRGY